MLIPFPYKLYKIYIKWVVLKFCVCVFIGQGRKMWEYYCWFKVGVLLRSKNGTKYN